MKTISNLSNRITGIKDRGRQLLRRTAVSAYDLVHGLAYMKKSGTIALIGTSAGVAVVLMVALVIANSHAVGVSINGQSVGYVADTETFTALVEDVKNDISAENLGAVIVLENQEGKLTLADFNENTNVISYIDKNQLKETLLDSAMLSASAYVVTVDGNPIVMLATEAEAGELLNRIIGQYADPNLLSEYAWVQDVKIENVVEPIGTVDLSTVEAAVGLLTPYVDITTIEIEVTQESIPFDTIKEDSSEFYIGQKKISIEGVPGAQEVTRRIWKVNGEVMESVDLNTVVLATPQTQTEQIGTTRRPATGALETGGENLLIQPMDRLLVSDKFGGYRRHIGVDFSTHVGTPIYASADGTVVEAKYTPDYGYVIVIDHEANIQTLYGHCSSLNVTAGDAVTQGQVIALSGNTGRSTGPHLHFEVRINGKQVDPIPFI